MNWVFLVLIAAVLMAAANIIRKHVLNKEHTLEFLAARGFFTVLFLLLLIPWVNVSIGPRRLGLIYLASLVTTVGYYYQTRASRHNEISYYAPLQNLSPLLIFVFAYLFLHETITPVELLGMLALVIGSYTVATENGSGLFGPLKEFLSPRWSSIAISLVALAGAAVLDKFMLGLVDPVTFLFFCWLFMNINYIILDWLRYDWKHILVDFQKGWHWLALCAALSIVSMLFFYTALALPLVLVSLALPLRRVSAFFETVFGGALFHEQNMLRRIFACIIMLVGIALIAAK